MGLGYLFAAYTVISVLLAGYMLLQGKRQKQLQKEVRMLMEMVDETEARAAKQGSQTSTSKIGATQLEL